MSLSFDITKVQIKSKEEVNNIIFDNESGLLTRSRPELQDVIMLDVSVGRTSLHNLKLAITGL